MPYTFPTATPGVVATADEYNQVKTVVGTNTTSDGFVDASRVKGDLPGGVGTEAATKIALGVVVQRELNVCDPAFGADPTGVADSTAAFKAAIVAMLGGPIPGPIPVGGCPIGIVFDGVVATSGTHLTSAAGDFTGLSGQFVNIPGAGLNGVQYFGVLTATGQHTATLAPAPSTAIASGATLVYGTQLATRSAVAPIYIPAGRYKLTGDLRIVSALNVTFRGAGPASVLVFSGAGCTYGLYCNGIANWSIGDFAVEGDTTEALRETVSIQWTGYATDGTDGPHNLIQRTTTRGVLHPVTISNSVFITGIGVGTSSADMQVDQMALAQPIVYASSASLQRVPATQDATYWQDGILVGSNVSGNVDIVDVKDPKVFYCKRGIRNAQAKGMSVIGGGTQDCGTDIVVNTQSYMVIDGMRSEGAGTFLAGGSGGQTTMSYVDVRNIDWHGNQINSDGKVVVWNAPGCLRFNTCKFYSTGATLPVMSFPTLGRKLEVILDGVAAQAPMEKLVSGNSNVTVSLRGYGYVNTSLQVDKGYQGTYLLGTYSPPLTVLITDAGGGTGGTATITQTDGVLNPPTVTAGGANYVSPVATIVGGGGLNGVLGTPVLSGGVIQSIPLTTPGFGYHTLSSGSVLKWGTLPTTPGTAATIDTVLARRGTGGNGAGLLGLDGNLDIGIDGYGPTYALTVRGPQAGLTAVLDWNDLIFNRTSGPSNIIQSGGQALIFKTLDGAAALQNRITLGAGTSTVNLTLAGVALVLSDATNIALGSTTGTKIGTATSQKIGFFNAPPVVQQTLAAAASDPTTTQALANSLRSALIALGLGA